MRKIRCKLDYHRTKNNMVVPFTLAVKDGVFGHNPPFITPPATDAAYTLLINSFSIKYAAYKAHTATKAEMEETRVLLMTGTDDLSTYVNTVADGDATVISLSGFTPTKGSNSEVNPPLQPTGITLERSIQGELLADCFPQADADSYGALLLADNELPEFITINGMGQIVVSQEHRPDAMAAEPFPSGVKFIQDLTKSRRKKFTGLQVGVTYYLYYWSMNAGGVSPLSVVVSRKVVEL